MSLFDDHNGAVKAAALARAEEALTEDVLNAALAALSREELVEKAARALHTEMFDGLTPDDDCGVCQAKARVVLVAVGLIPEPETEKR